MARLAFIVLGSMITTQVLAHEGYKDEVASLCLASQRPAPDATFGDENCAICHASSAGGDARTAKGQVWEAYRLDTSNNLKKTAVLDAFCPSSASGQSFYNLTQYTEGLDTRETLPAIWSPDAGSVGYTGVLDVYWLARLSTNQETVEVSRANAVAQGAPANFRLQVAPDNCWGMMMNFGLISLGQAANLTVTVAADGSSIKPAFALYQGWDTGSAATRHQTIYFNVNNPLGTSGLVFKGDQMGSTAGGSETKTFTGLAAGKYELFVTVGNNNSASGNYKVSLQTTPVDSVPTVPGSPLSPVAVAGDGQASVSWTAPASDGGASISGYTVTAAPGGGTCDSATTACVVTGLTNGTAYTFTVRAINRAGTGAASVASAPVTPRAATVPDAPTGVMAVAGDGSAVISWTPPASGGGAAITGYTVTSMPENRVCATTEATICHYAGLTNGVAYQFVVTASNRVGTSPVSTPSAPVTPSASAVNYVLSLAPAVGGVVTSSPAGIACGLACESAFASGTVVTLTAQPSQGYSFLEWGGACSGSADCQVTMDRVREVSASFKSLTAALTVQTTGQGSVVSSPAGIDCNSDCASTSYAFDLGQAITLNANPAAGWQFDGWSGEGCQGQTAACSLTLLNPLKIDANFVELPPNPEGVCGAANNGPAADFVKGGPNNCLSGTEKDGKKLPDGRYHWICAGDGETASALCYTLSQSKANTRQNQEPLLLFPGNEVMTSGGDITQTARGGSGSGKIAFAVKARGKVRCLSTRLGASQILIKPKAVGGGSGTCTVTATKARDRQYNAVSSLPAVITVNPAP